MSNQADTLPGAGEREEADPVLRDAVGPEEGGRDVAAEGRHGEAASSPSAAEAGTAASPDGSGEEAADGMSVAAAAEEGARGEAPDAAGDGARDEATDAAGDGTHDEASDAAGDGARGEAPDAAGDGARDEAPDAAGDGARGEALDAARDGARDEAPDATENDARGDAPDAAGNGMHAGEPEAAGASTPPEAPGAAGEGAADAAGPIDPEILAAAVRIAEALVFASDRPVTPHMLAAVLPEGVTAAPVMAALAEACEGRGVVLTEVAGGWAFRTAPDLAPRLTKVVQAPRRLPRAAMEALSIIAYHQPCTRGEIEEIRGAALAQTTLEALLELGLVAPRGRRDVPGRPTLWGTTPKFLEQFGLKALSDLPRKEELVTGDSGPALPGMVPEP